MAKHITITVSETGEGTFNMCSAHDVQPKNGTDFSLEELHEFVGGYIEIVQTIMPGMIMVINEEGKIHGLPVNPIATDLYKYHTHDVIVGNVLLCHTSEVK